MRHLQSQIIKISFLGFFSLLLSACSNDFSDLKTYIAKVKKRPATVIEPLPERKIIEPFIFEPEGLRNPFRPLIAEKEPEDFLEDFGEGGVKPNLTRRKEDLEEFPLDSLRMVGTMRMDSEEDLWGIIQAGDGSIHRAKAGSYMGKNFGKVVQISEDGIEIMEIISIKPGVWEEHPVSMTIAD